MQSKSKKVAGRITRDQVTSFNGTPDPMFEWPEFTSERERIKRNSSLFKDIDCSKAFSLYYGIRVKKVKETDSAYREVKPGDLIELRLLDVNKKTSIFDTGAFKENIVSAVNLFQYAKFKSGKWRKNMKVLCKVTAKEADKITVDPLAPLFDKWIKERLENIPNQYHLKEDRSIKVSNLRLINNAGFQGDVRVDPVSDFCGQDVCIKAFIPGSQIVLNIERDFPRWEGQTVNAFITNYIERKDARGDRMSLICSAKEYLKFQGDKNKIDIFNLYCLNDEDWKKVTDTVFDGTVTGIINSSKKQGVFVEIPKLNITGMIEMKSADLVHYHPGDQLRVSIKRIDEPMYYNEIADQMQHSKPYVIEDDILRKCSLRFVFQLAD